MFKNHKKVKRSRLNVKEIDFQFYMNQLDLSYHELERIIKIFDDKGGVLNRLQFKEVFENLNGKWLGHYENSSAISDLVFRAFDIGTLFYPNLNSRMLEGFYFRS